MRKPVLGRGLGRLMQSPETPSATEQTETLAPGLKILIRGAEASPATETAVQPEPEPHAQPGTMNQDVSQMGGALETAAASPATVHEATYTVEVPAGSAPETAELPVANTGSEPWKPVYGVALLLADLALIAWPSAWLYAQRGSTSWLALVGCVVSVLIGAGLGLLGIRSLMR